jgi:ABC-2 type transport system ATP-binding protein
MPHEVLKETSMDHSTIEMADVEKRFGGTRALDSVTVTAGRGVTGLLGPNGAGKTTLMRLIATVMAPDEGTIRLLGHDPARSDDRVRIRRRLGYMPQEPGFYQRFTAFEFIDYIAILKEMTDRRARHDEVLRVLEDVGLGDVAQRKVKALSGGMRRRLALAQALLGDPDLLLLDEPTAGLDPEQRLRFRELISQLAHRPTVLLSTHQTEDVTALCERVIVLAGGRIRFDGSPQALAESARGRVWVGEGREGRAVLSWRMGDGRHRNIGDPPSGAFEVEPTIDDAYLLMVGAHGVSAGAAA